MAEEHLLAQISQKAFIVKDSKAFLVEDRKHRFELPGGRLHVNEEPLAGLQREVQEELSVLIGSAEPCSSFVYTSTSGNHYFTLIYRVTIMGEPRPESAIAAGEILSAGWFSLQEIENLAMLDINRQILKKLLTGA